METFVGLTVSSSRDTTAISKTLKANGCGGANYILTIEVVMSINSAVAREARYLSMCAAVSGVLALIAAWAGWLDYQLSDVSFRTDPAQVLLVFVALLIVSYGVIGLVRVATWSIRGIRSS